MYNIKFMSHTLFNYCSCLFSFLYFFSFSRSEENVKASEYVLSAADDSLNQEPVGDMDAGWHEHLQAQSDLQFTSSTSTPYLKSEHSPILQE